MTRKQQNWEVRGLMMDHLKCFVHRFDYWLEMMVENADIIQKLYPKQAIDFKTHIRDSGLDKVPSTARIINFPLNPKPHQVTNIEWVRKFWIG